MIRLMFIFAMAQKILFKYRCLQKARKILLVDLKLSFQKSKTINFFMKFSFFLTFFFILFSQRKSIRQQTTKTISKVVKCIKNCEI